MSAGNTFRILILTTLLVATAASAQSDYLRISEDAAGEPAALQTSIVGFESAEGDARNLRIDLIGAIHMADASYYTTLNETFSNYDAMLYELVAPEGARPQQNSQPGNLISFTQTGLADLLGLTFQLNGIDYTKTNFVHADLTPQEMERNMSERQESFLSYMSRFFTAAMQGDVPEPSRPAGGPGLFELLFSPDRERLIKIEFAHSLLDVEWFSEVIEGDQGSTLIGARNARAFDVLTERIEQGDQHIAIFYGVGHMPDLASRIEIELDLERAEVSWIDAWNLSPASTP